MNDEVTIKKIDHVMMWSRDLEKTKRWYQDKLGFQAGYFAPGQFLTMNHPQMGRIDFHGCDDDTHIGKGPLPYFVVDDIAKVKRSLEARDIRVNDIQQEADSPKHTWFWDGDGNVLGLEEY